MIRREYALCALLLGIGLALVLVSGCGGESASGPQATPAPAKPALPCATLGQLVYHGLYTCDFGDRICTVASRYNSVAISCLPKGAP